MGKVQGSESVITVTVRAVLLQGLVLAAVTCGCCRGRDIDALLELKRGFGDPVELAGWERWRPGAPCNGSWRGVTCRLGTGFVSTLSLPRTFIGGHISPAIGDLPYLQLLDLSANLLSGAIPPAIANLTQLVTLDLSYNLLSGPLPQDWRSLVRLSSLTLTHNQLNGSIPGGISQAISLQRLRLENNSLSGDIPPQIATLPQLRYFAIEYNLISGPLSEQLGNLASLHSLYAAGNRLSGPLPTNIGSIPRLLHLELECNNLSGPIPSSWANLNHSLGTLNLSNNSLSGPIPPALARFNDSFANNLGLCGFPLAACPSPLPPEPARQQPRGRRPLPGDTVWRDEKSDKAKERIIGGVVGGLLGAFAVLLLLLVIFLVRQPRKRQRHIALSGRGAQTQNWFSPDVQATRREGKFKAFGTWASSYEEIVYHAGNFDTAHVLGKGRFATLYRSHLPNGIQLAVKVFKYASMGAIFEREIEMLASLKHPNLLPIKGYYSDAVEKAIIYDYMPQGSLYDLLHKRGTSRQADQLPDWGARQRIALGVAQALVYLHRGATYHVIHKDVKSSNILLEGDGLVPKLSDYGLVQLVSSKPSENAGVVDTPGYTDPHALAAKKYTEKSDVYSFGVVLMELVTGKRPVSFVDDRRLDLVTWVTSLHRVGRGREVMDPVAWRTSPLPEHMDKALGLAILCVGENPRLRPDMPEVASVLEGLASNPSILRSPERQHVSQRRLLSPST